MQVHRLLIIIIYVVAIFWEKYFYYRQNESWFSLLIYLEWSDSWEKFSNYNNIHILKSRFLSFIYCAIFLLFFLNHLENKVRHGFYFSEEIFGFIHTRTINCYLKENEIKQIFSGTAHNTLSMNNNKWISYYSYTLHNHLCIIGLWNYFQWQIVGLIWKLILWKGPHIASSAQ